MRLIFLVSCLSAGIGCGYGRVLSSGESRISREAIWYYVDSQKALTIAQVLRAKNFRQAGADVINFGFTQSRIWIKLKLPNKMVGDEWMLAIDNPNLDRVEVYTASGITLFKKSSHNAVSIIPIPRDSETVFIAVESENSIYLPFELAERDSLIARRHNLDLWQGVYCGIILSLVLYNFFIYLSVHDRTYLFYAIYTLLMGCTCLYFAGYFTQIGGPIGLNQQYILGSIGVSFGLGFVLQFFKKPLLSYRKIAAVGWLLISFMWVSFLLGVLSTPYFGNIIFLATGLLAALYALFVGIWSWTKNAFRPARFFVTAWVVFVGGVVVYVLKDFNLLPHNMLTQSVIQVGHAVEAILLSRALGDKISFLQMEKRVAEEMQREQLLKYDQLLRQQNSTLRRMVSERTIELERANGIKDKFFSIIGHDLKGPLSSISAVLELFNNKLNTSLTTAEMGMLTLKLNTSVKSTISLVDNLLMWARSEMKLDTPQVREINLEEVVKECVNELRLVAELKRVSLIDNIETTRIVFDVNQLRFVIRNLISNAIKFTPSGGAVVVTWKEDGDHLCLVVSDTGVGIPPELLDAIFEPSKGKVRFGTNGEKGTGLGLFLCREFVEGNGGKIRVVSSVAKGTSFEVMFLKANSGLVV